MKEIIDEGFQLYWLRYSNNYFIVKANGALLYNYFKNSPKISYLND